MSARPGRVPAATPPAVAPSALALERAERLAAGLFPHQVDGVAFLLGRRRAILADDMGLGKTRQSVVAMVEAAPIGPWLVVTPASVKRNWAREIAAVRPWDAIEIVGPDDPPEVGYTGWVVVNYDLLAKVDALLEDLPWTGIVFDEAHYLKNHTSQRSKCARSLVETAPRAVVHLLTGTPLTSRPRDLFPLLQLAGHPMGRSFLPFAKRYCDAHHNGFGWVADGASNLGELRAQLHGVMLRRTKDEVLDLPPKLRSWVPVAVPAGTGRAATRKVLATLIAGALERGRGRKATAKTPRTTASASRRAPGGERVRLLADLTTARLQIAKAKVDTTIEFVDGVVAQGEKALVFTSFDDPARRIAEHFGDAAVLLTGATPAHARQRLVDRFQKDDTVQVFVANLAAGGVGLNLTAARQVVFNDLDWVPANHWQAEDRAYRIGQTGSVNVTYLVGEGTVEEFVAHTLHAKAALVDAVVEGGAADAVPGDVLAELERLLGALAPDVASLADGERGEDPVDRLLRAVSAAAAARDAERGVSAEERARLAAIRTLPGDAILGLARALSAPAAVRYRAASGSKPGESYELDADGGDVTCGCRGFEYRGACSHARALAAALAAGGALPPGFTREA